MSKKITIAIDGYSSTGKSTIAKQLAKSWDMFMLIVVQCIEL